MAAVGLPPLPNESSQAAAIAFTAVYFLLSLLAYAYFAVWKYKAYLLAALGAGGRFTGFLLRAVFLAGGNVSVSAASSVFITAGMSACTSSQCDVLSNWFRNAEAAKRLPLHAARPSLLPTAMRLLSLPVLVFGPGLGVPATVLLYGVGTPSAIAHAQRLRRWSAWGTLACLVVLTLAALLAVLLACGAEGRGKPGCLRMPLVCTVLLSALMLCVSAAARVRTLHQPSVSTDDALYYCLIILPELLQQLLASFPTLLHRTGCADAYRGWRTGVWGWVARRFPAAAAADAEVGGRGDAAAKAAQSAGSPRRQATSLTADSSQAGGQVVGLCVVAL